MRASLIIGFGAVVASGCSVNDGCQNFGDGPNLRVSDGEPVTRQIRVQNESPILRGRINGSVYTVPDRPLGTSGVVAPFLPGLADGVYEAKLQLVASVPTLEIEGRLLALRGPITCE